jgi:hypothetical protein
VELQAPQQHGGDRRHRIGLKEVGGHAGTVAHVVAHVVSDDGRIAGVVLGNPGLDLAHQIGADVGGLGVDATSEAGEDRDQRGAEGQSHYRLRLVHDPEGDRDSEQAEAHHEEAGDGAAVEGHAQGGADPAAGGLGGAVVAAHRHVHPDVAGAGRQGRPEQEQQRRLPPERRVDQPSQGEQDRQHHPDHRDDRVLPVQVGRGALPDGLADLLHPLVARGSAHDPAGEHAAVDQGEHPGHQNRDQNGSVHERDHLPAARRDFLELLEWAWAQRRQRWRPKLPDYIGVDPATAMYPDQRWLAARPQPDRLR